MENFLFVFKSTSSGECVTIVGTSFAYPEEPNRRFFTWKFSMRGRSGDLSHMEHEYDLSPDKLGHIMDDAFQAALCELRKGDADVKLVKFDTWKNP